MKILFACGGTAGHINPAIAVATYLREQKPDTKILFAGNPNSMEERIVKENGFDFSPIELKGIQRKINKRNIKYNISSIMLLTTATKRCKRLINEFSPDIIMGTGGYVSGPIVRCGAKMGIKTLSHEQNAFPGVTTRLLSKHVNRLLLAVGEAKEYLPQDVETTVVGNPIRESILFAEKKQSRKKLGIDDDKFCILSFGGSLGARKMNEAIAELIRWHEKEGKIHHIHATGKIGKDYFEELLDEKIPSWKSNKNLDIREYISDMDVALSAADLVISRAGAITLSELQGAGKASITIPSPNVSHNHQFYNADVLRKKNATILIEEKDLTDKLLIDTINDLVQNPQKIKDIEQNAQQMAIIDTNKRIYEIIMDLYSK
ncbi:MAG: undecaprenyldiphospho-muramoylpentapeptide beta-N-acetylglucosaminyltransferase [Oscillospiraceae bacterium]